MSTSPRLSVVVVVHDMPRQAANTLFSLSSRYQLGVDEDDVEVIVVENTSEHLLGERVATSFGRNFRYLQCTPTNRSPVQALARGVQISRAPHLALMIDGARMLTPRVLHYMLLAFRVTDDAMVTVPGYHLGADEQHKLHTYAPAEEIAALERIDWRSDGYRLFTIGVLFRGRHQPGYLRSMLESNCLACSRDNYDRAGGIDLRFDLPGGGMANLDLYRRIGDLPRTRLFVLPGEGSFHQYHGGVTTRPDAEREAMMTRFKDQYAALRGGPYRRVAKKPTVLGAVTGWAMPTLRDSAQAELARIRGEES